MMRLLLTLSLLIGLAAQAAKKMDLETHDLVINKLEGVTGNLQNTDAQQLPVLLRLADLYADRARLRAMAEAEKSCTDGCLGSLSDRQRALQIYQRAFQQSDKTQQGRLLLQMSHLYQSIGQTEQAAKLLHQIINAGAARYGRQTLGMAYNTLGEIEYRDSRFTQAKYYFGRAFQERSIPRRGFALYRLAWSNFNLGNLEAAIEQMTTLLSSRELLNLGDGATPEGHNSFNEDVARDFATFLARRPMTADHINLLLKLTPEPIRRSNLFYLATEAERLGQKSSAILIWTTYTKTGNLQNLEPLEIQIRLAQLHFDLGQKNQAVTEYQKATQIWKTQGCSQEEECNELRIRLRNFVTTWNRLEKKNPSPQLLQVYQSYGDVFPKDVEMHFWAGQIGQTKQQFEDAVRSFAKAADLAQAELKSGKSHLDQPTLQRLLAGSLLGEVEAAESTKKLPIKIAAYNHYLALLPQGARAADIRYQIAHTLYEDGQHREAAEQFRRLAVDARLSNPKLGEKSADLALDSLVILKDDQNLERWSLEFAGYYSNRRLEYLRIARKSSINQSALVINNSKSSKTDQARALDRLSSVNLAGASDAERASYYRNQMILAVRTRNLEKVRGSAEQLLKIKSVSAGDRDEALKNLIWVAELNLDFGTAYRLTRDELAAGKQARNHALDLRLAMLAELAGRDPSPHFFQYLEKTNSLQQANLVRIQLIRRSRQPWRELDKHLSQLKRTPALLAQIALEAQARQKNLRRLEQIVRVPGVENTPSGQVMARQLAYRTLDQRAQSVSRHQLDRRSDSRLQKSIRQRMTALAQLEALAADAIRARDWTMQALTLKVLATENRRFYRDLLALPAPKGLNKKQREEYQSILAHQADPYIRMARDYDGRVNDLWNQSDAAARLERDFKDGRRELRPLVQSEAARLASAAPTANLAVRLKKLAQASTPNPDAQEIRELKADLQRDPFNQSLLLELKSLEEKRGSDTMVAFLDSRLEQLAKEKKQ